MVIRCWSTIFKLLILYYFINFGFISKSFIIFRSIWKHISFWGDWKIVILETYFWLILASCVSPFFFAAMRNLHQISRFLHTFLRIEILFFFALRWIKKRNLITGWENRHILTHAYMTFAYWQIENRGVIKIKQNPLWLVHMWTRKWYWVFTKLV